MKLTMQYNITGLSLLELRAKYGTGSKGFWPSNDWWLDEKFAKEKPKPGVYEIDFERKNTNLTFAEQKKKCPKGWSFTHPAVLAEAVFSHYEKTGERLMEDWWGRSDVTSSVGNLVYFGFFDARGARVHRWRPDDADDYLGAPFSRSLSGLKLESVDPLKLESRVKKLEEDMKKLKKIIIN